MSYSHDDVQRIVYVSVAMSDALNSGAGKSLDVAFDHFSQLTRLIDSRAPVRDVMALVEVVERKLRT